MRSSIKALIQVVCFGLPWQIRRCYEKGNEHELGYLLVADLSQDPTEPDISTYEDNGIAELDRFLQSEVRNLMARGVHPTQLRNWVKQLADDPQHAFPGRGQMKPEQLEIAQLKRNVVIAGCFDVSRAAELAKPIFYALNDAIPLENQAP